MSFKHDTNGHKASQIWNKLCKIPVMSAQSIAGGRNSQVFRLNLSDGQTVIAKHYFRHPGDPRDRMSVEVKALQLLHGHGIRAVPMILAVDEENSVAILEHISGTRVSLATLDDAEQAVQFLGSLKKIADSVQYDLADPASEAFFSPDGLMDNVRFRLTRLSNAPNESSVVGRMHAFLHEQLAPALDQAENHCRERLDFEEKLPRSRQTLSPSDFGFHNALRGADNRLWFLDFEYFGWDDPAKTLCDMDLHPHPLMDLEPKVRERLLKKSLQGLQPGKWLYDRSIALYPIFVVKWCCILLNEFIPADLERRRFSNACQPEKNVLQRQLQKAENLLNQSWEKYERFRRCLA
ncbi:aminoglycoside phosphotransferase family protein [Desulfonatronovibrio magnus]|uniref:aminoglycoside phosphotransferase family protein n=1 Tax=Desulfonatronovibrio magnus TaxID=698827 RepID=UPI0006961817|nr:aminoglycoside phosphotransferase family protein [Desulfonatronovibrio magnus]